MHRFFVDPREMASERFPLPASIAHQVSRVLRLRDGERLMLLDGRGEAVVCRLEQDECLVESRGAASGEPRHRLIAWQALLRGDHLEPVAAAFRRPGGGRAVGAGPRAAGRGRDVL